MGYRKSAGPARFLECQNENISPSKPWCISDNGCSNISKSWRFARDCRGLYAEGASRNRTCSA